MKVPSVVITALMSSYRMSFQLVKAAKLFSNEAQTEASENASRGFGTNYEARSCHLLRRYQ
jgi:hypothetical protein